MDETYKVNRVVLTVSDIVDYFDCEYHHFLQGTCTHNGKIYSLEGFTHNENNPAALRIISPADKRQELFVLFSYLDFNNEPEFIDFKGDTCYLSDCFGNLYILEF